MRPQPHHAPGTGSARTKARNERRKRLRQRKRTEIPLGPPPTCNDCAFWDPYAPGLGECLEYLRRREAAYARWPGDKASFDAKWPLIAAPDTEATDTCDKHQPIT